MSDSPQLALDLQRPLRPTLDNFVPGRNREALAALRATAAGDQGAERIVYLWGESGSGRTHLLQALGTAPGAFAWTPETAAARPGIALVDDVDALDAAAQVALFNRFNAVRAAAGQTGQAHCACVAAGPRPPARLALREDLRTRLAWGLVYEIQALSDEEKIDALAAHAASRGLQMAPDVAPWLLRHLPRDMRALVAALDALDAYALARKRALTLALAREAFAGAGSHGTT